MYDLVEWAAAQPWCDGNVGMIGISYFAMTQLEAAVERPPHLKAIFPVAVTADLYEAATHHGLVSSSFVTPFLSMIGLTAARSDDFWRSLPLELARKVLHAPPLHRKFATMNGEAAVTDDAAAAQAPPRPASLGRPVARRRGQAPDPRRVVGRAGSHCRCSTEIDIPVYLGCDWENVPLHLPSTFVAWKALAHNPNVRMGMLGQVRADLAVGEPAHRGARLVRPLAQGPRHRHRRRPDRSATALPGQTRWRTSESWPPTATHRELALRADGVLDEDEGEPGARDYMVLGAGLNRAAASSIDPPGMLTWTSAPLETDVDIVGEIELRLVASATAADTAWIATLQDVARDGEVTDVTAGWLRASLREVDEAASTPGAPVLPCRTAIAVPIAEDVEYRIPLVPNARRFAAGNRIRLTLTSDDQNPETPAIMNFRHASVGTSSLNTIRSSSRLLLPVLA